LKKLPYSNKNLVNDQKLEDVIKPLCNSEEKSIASLANEVFIYYLLIYLFINLLIYLFIYLHTYILNYKFNDIFDKQLYS